MLGDSIEQADEIKWGKGGRHPVIITFYMEM